jgi:arylsulfatase A-like enzyme
LGFIGLGLAISLMVSVWGCRTRPRIQPNIVFILADDLGWKDVGFMGSQYYETPYLDDLAARGMIFTQAYSAGPNCAPSRACIMTGRYTPRHGVYTVNSAERGESRLRRLIPVSNTTTLAAGEFSLAEALGQAGYACAAFGKWHLGPLPDFGPVSQGFDLNVAGDRVGHPPAGYFAPYRLPGVEEAPEGEYLTDRLTDEALAFIHAHRNRPFFVYLSHYAVHTPLQAPGPLIEKYRRKPGSQGRNHPVYAAMIENLDSNIGRLLAKLDEWGLMRDTLVIFTSDNGGVRRITSQAPLRGGKGMLYEGGIRVPQLVCWPGKVPAGTVCDVPVSGIDFFPSLLEIIGLQAPEAIAMDGMSLAPLFFGSNKRISRSLHWHFPAYLEGEAQGARDPLFRTRPAAAVRRGDWKLIEYFEDGALELYNLAEDVGEQNNRASADPAKTSELYDIMKAWRKAVRAPVPTRLNPEYGPQK